MGERGLVQTAGEEKACLGPETRAEPPGVPVSKGQAGRRAWKLWMEQREKPECDVQEAPARQCLLMGRERVWSWRLQGSHCLLASPWRS